jgi:hypothetical protein
VALGVMLHWLAPNVTERLLLHALNKFHLVSAQPHTRGNLFGPTSSKASVRGVRGPVVGCLAFAAWAAVDLLRIGRTRLRPRKPPPAVAPASSTP